MKKAYFSNKLISFLQKKSTELIYVSLFFSLLGYKYLIFGCLQYFTSKQTLLFQSEKMTCLVENHHENPKIFGTNELITGDGLLEEYACFKTDNEKVNKVFFYLVY